MKAKTSLVRHRALLFYFTRRAQRHDVFCLWWLFIGATGFSQTPFTLENAALDSTIEILRQNEKIKADSVWNVLSTWNDYPDISAGKDYLVMVQDTFFGAVPVNVFVPPGYKPDVRTPMILMLHGAVNSSNFEKAYQQDSLGHRDFFFDFFKNKGYIIVRPHADPAKKFDWSANAFEGSANKTFFTLANILAKLKKCLNVDDSRVFAFGFSDGADGAFALDVYDPSTFAGVICYNSMLVNIDAQDMYLKNTVNRPMYLVHSDKDEIRPAQQTRAIVALLDSLLCPLLYKEYSGYRHYDKHLPADLPYSAQYMSALSRNPFKNFVYWETCDRALAGCDWLRILDFDPNRAGADWHSTANTYGYSKRNNAFIDVPYYQYRGNSAAVYASYNNNSFNIITSRVTALEIMISPVMVTLENPVMVFLNGKRVFKAKVTADKELLTNEFYRHFDRQSLWVRSIKLKVD